MMTLDLKTLQSLLTRVSATEGISNGELANLLSDAFRGERSAKDLNDYRLGTRPWKKLRDEVSPVSGFLNYEALEGVVRFPLDNQVPDAWFIPAGGTSVGIEVTRALGRTNYELSKELVRDGRGRGFLGLQDNAPKADFDQALKRPRAMYTTQQALDTASAGIRRCLEAKDDPKYAGMWLLVLAPLSTLPRERWDVIVPALRQQAAPMPFDQIHVFEGRSDRPWGFRIK